VITNLGPSKVLVINVTSALKKFTYSDFK